MRLVKSIAFQGDVAFIRVEKRPADVKLEKTNIVAHSETGHHHVVEGNAFRYFKQDDMTSFLELKEPVKIVHKRPFDTHQTFMLDVGDWMVRRQRERRPEGWARVED